MLEVRNLYKTFGYVRAVWDLSFKVGEGEILGLIGPNGSGKTTTIDCISSLLIPDRGKIKIMGHDVFSEPIEAKKHLAYVPDVPNHYSDLTVWQHIEFTARVFRMQDWEDKAEALLKRFDLTKKKDDDATWLSKGQEQKLSLICAFIHEPRVVLLDEPLYGIDPRGGKQLKLLVKEAQAKGACFVISSHMLDLVEELATRYLIISEGRKIMEGTLKDIKSAVHLARDSKLEDVFLEVTKTEAG